MYTKYLGVDLSNLNGRLLLIGFH